MIIFSTIKSMWSSSAESESTNETGDVRIASHSEDHVEPSQARGLSLNLRMKGTVRGAVNRVGMKLGESRPLKFGIAALIGDSSIHPIGSVKRYGLRSPVGGHMAGYLPVALGSFTSEAVETAVGMRVRKKMERAGAPRFNFNTNLSFLSLTNIATGLAKGAAGAAVCIPFDVLSGSMITLARNGVNPTVGATLDLTLAEAGLGRRMATTWLDWTLLHGPFSLVTHVCGSGARSAMGIQYPMSGSGSGSLPPLERRFKAMVLGSVLSNAVSYGIETAYMYRFKPSSVSGSAAHHAWVYVGRVAWTVANGAAFMMGLEVVTRFEAWCRRAGKDD